MWCLRALQPPIFRPPLPAPTHPYRRSIMLAYYWLTYCILRRKQPRYQPLEAPPA